MTAQDRWTAARVETLMSFLLGTLGKKQAEAKRLLKFGAVQVNGVVVRRFDYPLAPGSVVSLTNTRGADALKQLAQSRIEIVFEDDALIVVEKPSGLLTVATDRQKADTLFVRVNDYLRSQRSTATVRTCVVHRLDRETSGLVLFAKGEEVQRSLQANWSKVKKTYLAVVRGRPASDAGRVTSYLTEDAKSLRVSSSDHARPGSQHAVTHYRLMESKGARSLLEIRLETGRKHQIRVHLASLGCAVLGDRRYGEGTQSVRLALHAAGLGFSHPLTSETVTCKSALPRVLRKLLN